MICLCQLIPRNVISRSFFILLFTFEKFAKLNIMVEKGTQLGKYTFRLFKSKIFDYEDSLICFLVIAFHFSPGQCERLIVFIYLNVIFKLFSKIPIFQT